MNKVISFIISATMFLSFVPVYATDGASAIRYPQEGAELGYLFSLKSEPNTLFNPDDYEGIQLASKMSNIYFSDTIAHIKMIENIVNIDVVTENWSLTTPEPPIESISDDTQFSLFSYEEGDGIGSVVPYSDEKNIEETPYLNDPFYEQMWHYDAIKAHAFRGNGITGGGVKVGIIDTGLTKDTEKFPDFCEFDNVDIETGINICAKIDNMDDLLYDTSDNYYHGTSVASIICAKANNNYGIAGLMDGCTIVPYKVEDYRCSKTANSLLSIIIAIEEAYNDGCDVVNISQGTDANLDDKYVDMLNTAFNKAVENGMIVVAASGNSGDDDNHVEYPAACNYVIGVGATRPDCAKEYMCFDGYTGLLKPESEATPQDSGTTGYHRGTIIDFPDNKYVKLELSTANESVFVCAPGINIPAVECRSTAKRPFASRIGTSDATPIVASAAIGVKQMRPYVDTDMFKDILQATAVDLEDEGYDINTGYGMVNFERIYDYVSQMPLTAPERTPEVSIDYENEHLIGFPINRTYAINGVEVAVSENGTLPIEEEWFGTTVEIVKKASSEGYEDSEPQKIDIPVRPELPDTVYGTNYGIANDNQDKISYMSINGEEWINTYFALELPNGTYLVKLASTSTAFSSSPKKIDVGKQTIGIEIDYANETLVNFEDERNYTINGESVNISESGTLPINEEWFGTTVLVARDNDATEEISIPARASAPVITLMSDNTVNVASNIIYREENSAEWKKSNSNGTITLEQGKTYFFKVQYTENSFASEVRQITVQFAPIEQYEIETSIVYDPDSRECTYSAVNNTIWTINAVGIIAVYAPDGVLKHLETIDLFPADGVEKKLNFTLSDGDTVKFFIWDSFKSMQPRDKVKSSEYVVAFDKTE